jgi:uncharacterized membrane protein YcaP (DUF421 family)
MFKGWLDVSWARLGGVALRSIVIYFVFLVGLRAFGKRQVGQFTFFDMALVLLLANALQPAMTGPDTSVTAGLLIIAVLLLLNWLIARLRLRNRRFRELVEGTPTVIARDGSWLKGPRAGRASTWRTP